MQEVPPLRMASFRDSESERCGAAPSNEPLRVVHAVLSMEVGGLERIVVDLVREGRRLHHQLTVLCVERSGVFAEVDAEGGKVICVNKGPGVRLKVVRDVRRVLQEIQPHVLHSHQVGALLYCGPALGVRRSRWWCIPSTESTSPTASRHAFSAALRALRKRYFCVSQDVAEEIRACRIVPAIKSASSYNGIRPTFRSPPVIDGLRAQYGIPADALVLGTVGRLAEVKRQDILIRGFAGPQAVSNVHLLLVGDGVMRMSSLHWRRTANWRHLSISPATSPTRRPPSDHGYLCPRPAARRECPWESSKPGRRACRWSLRAWVGCRN